MSLDMFAKEGIVALRRAKRRNMERSVFSYFSHMFLSCVCLITHILLSSTMSCTCFRFLFWHNYENLLHFKKKSVVSPRGTETCVSIVTHESTEP